MRTWPSACPVCPRSPASRANPENCKSHPKASASDAFFILKPHFSRPPRRAFSSSWRNPPCFRVSSESSAFPSGNPRRGFPAVQRPSCALEGKRISSSAEDDGGAAPRPRRLLQKAGENLGAASPLTHSPSSPAKSRLLGIPPCFRVSLGEGPFYKRAPSPKPPSPKTLGERTAGKKRGNDCIRIAVVPLLFFPSSPLKF